MKTFATVSVVGLALGTIRDVVMTRMKRKVGSNVHKETLKRVLLAPVNIFFDVTPIGKILNIFTGSMHVFYGGIIEPIKHIMNMSSHVLVVFYFLFSIGNWRILIPVLAVMFVLMYRISLPYLSCDNQLHKVGSNLWTPIHSFFHESMRGKSIIRAFQQEESIMARQNALLDHTTTHFIAHHSCWIYYNLRMTYATMIFSVLTVVVCVMNKGLVSNTSLVIAL